MVLREEAALFLIQCCLNVWLQPSLLRMVPCLVRALGPSRSVPHAPTPSLLVFPLAQVGDAVNDPLVFNALVAAIDAFVAQRGAVERRLRVLSRLLLCLKCFPGALPVLVLALLLLSIFC